jgi:hypothetical protein
MANTNLKKQNVGTKKQKLTNKQKGFVKDYIANGGNGTEAALQNYKIKSKNKVDVAKSIASENLTKPYIADKVKSIAEQIPDELLVKVQIEGLSANRSIAVGEQIIETADHAVRHKFLDSGLKLKGAYAPEKSLNVNVSINPENRERMTEVAKEVALKIAHEETNKTI